MCIYTHLYKYIFINRPERCDAEKDLEHLRSYWFVAINLFLPDTNCRYRRYWIRGAKMDQVFKLFFVQLSLAIDRSITRLAHNTFCCSPANAAQNSVARRHSLMAINSKF